MFRFTSRRILNASINSAEKKAETHTTDSRWILGACAGYLFIATALEIEGRKEKVKEKECEKNKSFSRMWKLKAAQIQSWNKEDEVAFGKGANGPSK